MRLRISMRLARRVLSRSILGVAAAGSWSGVAAAQIRVIVDSSEPHYATSVRMLGDLDGDGRREFIVGANLGNKGAASVRYGKDGTELRRHDGENVGDEFGAVLERLADVNGDGIADYVVSAPEFDTVQYQNTGKIYVYSGADGSSLWTQIGFGNDKGWATQLAAVGDANGDGATDFVVNKPKGGSSFGGQLQLLSGKDGTTLWTFDASRKISLGEVLASVADVDGDGVDEVAAWAPDDGHFPDFCAVFVYSGKYAPLIWATAGGIGEAFGRSFADVDDVDGDGIHDIAIAIPGRNHFGAIEIRSGIDGLGIAEHAIGNPTYVSAGFDADGDGDADFIASHVDSTSTRKWSVFDAWSGTEKAEMVVNRLFSTDSADDFDGDGFDDLLWGGIATDGNNHAQVVSFRSPPAVTSVTPPRGDHRADSAVTIAGSGFLLAQSLQVDFNANAAGNVAVVDDATLTCTALAADPGPVDVTVTTDAGTATLANGFAFTPALIVEGTPTPGGALHLRFLCDAGDSLFILAGVPPQVSIPTPPFDGKLCIFPFLPVGVFVSPTTELDLDGTIPNDPALIGQTFLVQALVGPQLTGAGKQGSWTDCGVVRIQ